MPLLTTEAVVGFKSFFEFAAATYRDPVFSPDAVPTPDRPYWEQGAAQCEACGWRITAGCVAHCMTCGSVDICAACMGSRLHAHGPHFHAPGHMWTLFVLATGACGYANMDNAPTFGSSVPASGKHKFLGTGFYVQGPDRTAMTLEIKFDGSKVKGRGVDAIGGFKIRGERQLETNRVCFEKRYESHTIEYDATLVDGAMLVGSWNFQHQDSGPFVLVLEAKKESFEVVEKAKWSGHYVQNATHFPTSMKLSILSTGRIEGSGRDDVGEYLISGRFLENGTITGPFLFTKKYETHAISYDGVRQGSVMTGTYQSPGTGRDAFMLQMTYQ